MATISTTSTIASKLLTAEQFLEQYGDVPFCELERGEVIQLTAGGWRHSRICLLIARILDEWAVFARTGRVLTNDAGLITERDPDSVRGIDVAFFSYQRVPEGQEPNGFATTPPELAVEVLGKGQSWARMYRKAGEYLDVGVERVWLVDPVKRTVNVFRRDSGLSTYGENDTLTDDEILPGFSCKVADFFAA